MDLISSRLTEAGRQPQPRRIIGGSLIASRGRRPASASAILSTARNSIARRTLSTADPRCGVNSVRGCARSRGSSQARPIRERPVLHFEYIGGVTAQRTVFQRGGHGELVHHGSAPHIDKQRAGPHSRNRVLPDEMACRSCQRCSQDDEVAFFERGVQFAANDAARQFRVRIDAENPATETAQAFDDGAAHLSHADHSDSRAIEAGAVQNRTPAIERTRPDDLVSLADHPAKADGEADCEFRRRLG